MATSRISTSKLTNPNRSDSFLAGGSSLPSTPNIGTATDAGSGRAYNNGAASVAFTSGGINGTSYTATSSPSGFTATGASSPLTVTGLASSTSYTYSVTATNAVGTSPVSASSNSVTATTVPQAPTIGTATDLGSGTTVSVAYTAGATGGAAVSAYTATSSPGGLTGTGASPITVSGLTAGTAYTFTVTATNANGTSAASAASNSVTPVVPTNFFLISQSTLSAVANTTFSSIPSTYKSLQIRFNIASSLGAQVFTTNYNSDTSSANYAFRSMYYGGSGVSGFRYPSGTNGYHQFFTANGTFTSSPNVGIIDIIDYANTNKVKTIKMMAGNNENTAYGDIELSSGLWISTAAINSIKLSIGSGTMTGTISLYGVS